MKKQILITIILLIFLILNLSGCNNNTTNNIILNSEEEKLIGTWTWEDQLEGNTTTIKYNFFSDKTFNITASYQDADYLSIGTWRIIDEKIILNTEGKILRNEYSLSNNNRSLILISADGNESILTKQ
jgi:hypothetical protein